MIPKHIQIFVLFTVAYFLSFFYRSANAIIAPDLIREMGLNAAQLGLMTSLFYGSFALIQVPLGISLDRWGPRWVTPMMMMSGVIGSLVFAVAPSYAVLALGRTLIGIGMAGTLMGGLKAFSEWFLPARFSTMSGLLIGLGSTGALVAATPLGWLNQTVGWRGVFAWGALVIALVAAAIAVWVRNSPPGAATTSTVTTGGSIGVIFGDNRFWRIALLAFFTNGTLLAFQGLWAGPYLFDVYRLDNTEAGNILFAISLGVTTGLLVSGWLSDRLGLTRVVVFGSVIFVGSQFILALRPPLVMVVPVGCLFGFFGAFNLMLLAQPRHVFPIALTGRAITAVNVFAVGGIFFIQWWLGLIINRFPVDSAGHYVPQAYTPALLFTGIGTLLALLWYLPMLRALGGAKAVPAAGELE